MAFITGYDPNKKKDDQQTTPMMGANAPQGAAAPAGAMQQNKSMASSAAPFTSAQQFAEANKSGTQRLFGNLRQTLDQGSKGARKEADTTADTFRSSVDTANQNVAGAESLAGDIKTAGGLYGYVANKAPGTPDESARFKSAVGGTLADENALEQQALTAMGANTSALQATAGASQKFGSQVGREALMNKILGQRSNALDTSALMVGQKQGMSDLQGQLKSQALNYYAQQGELGKSGDVIGGLKTKEKELADMYGADTGFLSADAVGKDTQSAIDSDFTAADTKAKADLGGLQERIRNKNITEDDLVMMETLGVHGGNAVYGPTSSDMTNQIASMFQYDPTVLTKSRTMTDKTAANIKALQDLTGSNITDVKKEEGKFTPYSAMSDDIIATGQVNKDKYEDFNRLSELVKARRAEQQWMEENNPGFSFANPETDAMEARLKEAEKQGYGQFSNLGALLRSNRST